jgi:hypothetical protein
MSNLPYCRFHNTVQDLWDCYGHLQDDELSVDEQEKRKELINLCKQIVMDELPNLIKEEAYYE